MPGSRLARSAAAALLTGATAATACPGEGVFRSVESTQPTVIIFANASTSNEDTASVYWLDYDGRRQHYGDVFPGQVLRLETYVTHPWLVTYPEPGGGETCFHIYLPDPLPATVTLY